MARMEITLYKVKGIPVGGEREWSADDGLVIVRRLDKNLWAVDGGTEVSTYESATATAEAIWEALGW